MTLKFLNEEIELNEADRSDPLVLFYLSQIEFIEEKFGQGSEYIEKLINNYNLRLDINLENQIITILKNKHKQS